MSQSESAVGALHRPMVARLATEQHRTATALELFFDLCFVTAVAQAAVAFEHELAEGHIGHGVLGYALVFFAIWWAWMNFTWFASAYDTDDVPQESADTAVRAVLAEQPHLDVVVHNAAHLGIGVTEAFTDEQIAAIFDTNTIGPHRVNRAVLPHMRAREQGLPVKRRARRRRRTGLSWLSLPSAAHQGRRRLGARSDTDVPQPPTAPRLPMGLRPARHCPAHTSRCSCAHALTGIPPSLPGRAASGAVPIPVIRCRAPARYAMIKGQDAGRAGDGPVDKGKRITGTARETLAAQLKADYEGGASIRTLANSTGRSFGFVHRILTETGVTLRGRGGATPPKPGA